jgi:hypothetical protein
VDDEIIVTYNITVSNTGETRLKNVTLMDYLPPGMEFSDVRYSHEGKPDLLLLNRAKQDGDWLVNVMLRIGDLNTSENRLILLNASHDRQKNYPIDYYSNNSVYVSGEAPNYLKVAAENNTAGLLNDTNTVETGVNRSAENDTDTGSAGSPDNLSVINVPGTLNNSVNDSIGSPGMPPGIIN